MRQLAFEGAPRRDASGQLIASSSETEEDEKHNLQAVEGSATHMGRETSSGGDFGFADSDSDVEGGRAPQAVVPAASEHRVEGDGGDGFAEDSDVEMEGNASYSAAADLQLAAVSGDPGFVDSDHDEQEPAMGDIEAAPGVSIMDGDALGFAEDSEEDEPAAGVAAEPAFGFAEDDSDDSAEPLARRPPPKQKGKKKDAESVPARSKKTLPRPSEPKPKKKADASKSSKPKRPRVVESDSDSDRPLVSAPRPAPPPAAAPKMGLQGLKFKKHSEPAQVAPASKPATPPNLAPTPPPPIHHSASPPIVPPPAPIAPVQRHTSNDRSRDPRRRLSSVDVDGRSQSDKTSDSTKKAQVDDPFNKVRPVLKSR